MSEERPSELKVLRDQLRELDDMEMMLYGTIGRNIELLHKLIDESKRLEEIKGTEITSDRLKDAREFLHSSIYELSYNVAENIHRVVILHELRRKIIEKYVEQLAIQ
ncbi:MAG: hypothetical protein DRO40_09755 [Thermoprotei archaeon]|nr:MAG: hypothetical protein DRO40_09755 [Thermoprotei archaeon]